MVMLQEEEGGGGGGGGINYFYIHAQCTPYQRRLNCNQFI